MTCKLCQTSSNVWVSGVLIRKEDLPRIEQDTEVVVMTDSCIHSVCKTCFTLLLKTAARLLESQ